MTSYCEVNFDGLVGPTHHYGGYAYGNLASMQHKEEISNPKEAALQGLRKMKRLHDWGVKQMVLPPQMRPSIPHLRAFGFSGSDADVLATAHRQTPQLLHHLSSASSMWLANALTAAPSCDTLDGKLHITIANLQNRFHRSIEPEANTHLFQKIFADSSLFAVHPPLPSGGQMGDEGAANHIRLEGREGLHLFVYGKRAFKEEPHLYPARQALEASQAVARLNALPPSQTLFVQQNPELIDRGVFHNDVISLGHENFFLCHEKAFVNTEEIVAKLQTWGIETLVVTERQLPVEKAIESYLFNSQIVTLPSGERRLLAPKESETLDLSWLPIEVETIDLSESMRGGGGPACLRVGILMNPQELAALPQGIFLTDSLYQSLTQWVETHYRDKLTLSDLADPLLLRESHQASHDLHHLLSL